MVRRIWPLLICLAACAWAMASFDWAMVGTAFLRFDAWHFLSIGIPACLLLFLCRSLRWAAVAGLRFTPEVLWRNHSHTSLAIATAAVTPLQAGEALKMKFAHDQGGTDYTTLLAAMVIERLADIAALLGLGAIGFGLRSASGLWLAAAALGLALAVALAPAGARWLAGTPLPDRLRRPLLPLAAYRPAGWRMLVLGLGTVGKWACVVWLWDTTFTASGIALGFAETAMAMVLVTLSVTVSLVPGGLGVAEVSTRAVLLWLGVGAGLADGGAVMLRLQTPLIMGIGLLQGIPLLLARRAVRHG